MKYLFLGIFFSVTALAGNNKVEINEPLLLGRYILALSPGDRNSSPEDQVEMAYTRATNLCTFWNLPKGEFGSRVAIDVRLSSLAGGNSVSMLAMTSLGEWRVLKVTYPTRLDIFNRIVCEGRD